MNNRIIFEDAERVVKAVDFSSLEGKTILVTGATGLLGTHFLAVLALLKESGMKFENIYTESYSEPADYTKEIVQRIGAEARLTQNAFDFRYDADIAIHAAGYAQPAVFTSDPTATIRINTSKTDRMLAALHPEGKFLFVSSSEVYSGLSGLVSEYQIGNTTPLHPRACYIEGKRCGETIVNAYRQSGIDGKSVRLGLTYGPGTRKHDKRAMSTFIEQALTTDRLELQFSGREPRAFCYVSDAVEMMFQVLLRGKQPVYNVGGNSLANMQEVAGHIGGITGAEVCVPALETEMPGAEQTAQMDLTRIRTEFGKKDFISLEEGLEHTIEWQRGLYQ